MLVRKSAVQVKRIRRSLFSLASTALIAAIMPSVVLADPLPGTEYVTFWSGDLRIFAQEDNTEVLLVDIDTGLPLSISDSRITSTNVVSNPFILASAGDAFEGIGGTGLVLNEIRLRIRSSDALGSSETKPVTVWTGAIESSARHPNEPPNTLNPWMSYLPAFSEGAQVNSTEIGREFLGFATREMYIFARRDTVPTNIVVEDIATNTDPDSDDTITLSPADTVYSDGEIEIYFLDDFEDDTVRVTCNVDASLLVGASSTVADDWTVTPPSYAAGDDGIELGTLFYTFVNRSLTVFPTQDDTTVTITDLSDGDDTITVFLPQGDVIGDYSLYTPTISSVSGRDISPRTSSPLVNIIDNQGNTFDNDFVKVESDKPVLVYVGSVGRNVNEFADIAYSVPTGPDSRIIYAFAQNGYSNDLQIFGFDPATIVTITSLSFTEGVVGQHHDFLIGPGGTSNWKKGTPGGDVWWGSTAWHAEMLRIEATKPIVVINGDYDTPQFGAFIPSVLSAPTLPPVAVASASPLSPCAGDSVLFDGTASFDQDTIDGGEVPTYAWDFDIAYDSDSDGDPANDSDSAEPAPAHTYDSIGVFTTQLTYTDDDGQSDTDFVEVVVSCEDPLPPVAVASASPLSPCAGDSVLFDGTASFDQDTIDGGGIPTYTWDFDIAYDSDGDGDPANDSDASGTTPLHPYESVGVFTAQLTFTDDDGQSDTDFVEVTVDPCQTCGECESGVTQLTLLYTGDPATIEVYQGHVQSPQKLLYGPTFHNPGDRFTVDGGSNSKIGSEASFYEDNILDTIIHTSCSQPIGIGLVSGDFEVIDGYSFAGGRLPPIYPCTSPEDCDDANSCTNDRCDQCGFCINQPNTEPCDDGDACTSGDLCSQGACVSGSPVDCDDTNPCTDDSCDSGSGCTSTPNRPFDQDGDGYDDATCLGNDCDDTEGTVNPGASEVDCNGVDEDCSGSDHCPSACSGSAEASTSVANATYDSLELVEHLPYFLLPLGALIGLMARRRKR
jgi:hypothetical protein